MNKILMDEFPKCKYPVIAMYYHFDWQRRRSALCEKMNITQDLLDAFLSGREDLTRPEIYQFVKYTFRLQEHFSFHETARKWEYLYAPTIPFYMMKKRKHKNKVELVRAMYKKAYSEAKKYGIERLPVGNPDFRPLPYFGGIVLRKEIDTALYAIRAYRREISRITTIKVPRDITRAAAQN